MPESSMSSSESDASSRSSQKGLVGRTRSSAAAALLAKLGEADSDSSKHQAASSPFCRRLQGIAEEDAHGVKPDSQSSVAISTDSLSCSADSQLTPFTIKTSLSQNLSGVSLSYSQASSEVSGHSLTYSVASVGSSRGISRKTASDASPTPSMSDLDVAEFNKIVSEDASSLNMSHSSSVAVPQPTDARQAEMNQEQASRKSTRGKTRMITKFKKLLSL